MFKLLRFVDETTAADQLEGSARRIAVFILFVVILQVFLGYLMVLVESSHPESQFRSVGQGVYWASTMTTVGYGDVVPQTVLGRLLAAVMLLGFGIIAIPTGIVSYEAIRQGRRRRAAPLRLSRLAGADFTIAAARLTRCNAGQTTAGAALA